MLALVLFFVSNSIDNSLMSNIQKLFSEKIEIFSAVEFSKVSVLTGIVKISLKVSSYCALVISLQGGGWVLIFVDETYHTSACRISVSF